MVVACLVLLLSALPAQCLVGGSAAGRELCFEGKPSFLMALHKERYVIPVHLQVQRVSGVGSDSVFMGVIMVGGGSQ
jgi:hypothetical protein